MITRELLQRRIDFHTIILGNAESKVKYRREMLCNDALAIGYSGGQIGLAAIHLAEAEADVQASKAVLAELDALLLNCEGVTP